MAEGATITNLQIKLVSSSDKAITGLERLKASVAGLTGTTTKGAAGIVTMSKSFTNLAAKCTAAYVTLSKFSAVVGSWIKESNAYVENLNLFTVSMGEFAAEAKQYADEVGEVMGIDPSMWMRNQGVFMTLATGFGVAGDSAYKMSKNLTQLGYDLSSFFNIGVEDAMQKLQSGISGELEPLRRLGYDLSQAKLQQIAYANGINMSVSAMNQAQKSQLRYVAIMTQVTAVQGDWARTINAPANQLRILQSAALQASRALGNIFIPALNRILPYAIAFLNVIHAVAQALANLLGFKLPTIDYSGISAGAGAAGDLADAVGGSGDAAKQAAKDFKSYLMGIDELNVINPPDASVMGGGGGGSGSGGGGFGFESLGDDLGYTFLDAVNEKVKELTATFMEWLKWLQPVADAFAYLVASIKDFIANVIDKLKDSPALESLKQGLKDIRDALSKILIFVGDIFRNETFQALMTGAIGIALDTAGTALSVIATTLELIVSLLKGDGVGVIRSALILLVEILSWAARTIRTIFVAVESALYGLIISVLTVAKDVADMFGLDKLADGISNFIDKIKDNVEGLAKEYEIDIQVDKQNAEEAIESIRKKLGGLQEASNVLATNSEGKYLNRPGFERPDWYSSRIEGIKSSIEQDTPELAESAKKVPEAVITALSENPNIESATALGKDLMVGLSSGINDNASLVTDAITAVAGSLTTELRSSVDLATTSMFDGLKAQAETATESIITAFTPFTSSFETDVVKKVSGKWSEMCKDMKSNWSSMCDGILEKVRATVSDINAELAKIKTSILVTVKVRTLRLESGGVVQAKNGAIIPRAAVGGRFDQGQLFIAREAGPELVGYIGGGRTGVMNNNQLVESTAEALYRAFKEALADSGNSGGDKVVFQAFLDGKEIRTAVKRAEKQAGYNIVANPDFA